MKQSSVARADSVTTYTILNRLIIVSRLATEVFMRRVTGIGGTMGATIRAAKPAAGLG
ncbi:MAG: hypothetical protein ACK5PB_20540 [Pirellula sp.]